MLPTDMTTRLNIKSVHSQEYRYRKNFTKIRKRNVTNVSFLIRSLD